MWITRLAAIIACTSAPVGCTVHSYTATPAVMHDDVNTTQAHAANAMRELEQAGVPAFDAYVATLATSGDAIDFAAAQLLVELIAHVQRDHDATGPIVVGFAQSPSPAARTIADAIAIGLRKHPEFRVSDRVALDSISAEQRREYSGAFEDDSLAPVGTFRGLTAIGRVTIESTGDHSAITVRVTSMQSLLVLADARVTTNAILPADASVDMVRLAFPAFPALIAPMPPAECTADRTSQECKDALRRRAIRIAQEVRQLISSESRNGRPRICDRDPTLKTCR